MPDSAAQLLEIRQLEQESLSKLDVLDQQIAAAQQEDPILARKLKEQGLQILGDYELLISEQRGAEKDLEKSLATGSFITEGLDEENRTLDFSPEAITQRYQYGLSSYLNAPVDLSVGLDAKTRAGLAFKTAENKLEYLRNKFGEENVKRMDVGGGQVTLVRNPQDPENKFIATDEFGFSLKDAIDVSGEVFPAIGSIAGGGIALAKTKSPFAISTGSAAGYTAAASIQDAITSAVTRSGPSLLEAIPQRSFEAAVAMPVEYATLRVGGALGAGVAKVKKAKETPIQMVRRTEEDYLRREGIDVAFSSLARGGDQKLLRRLKTAQEMPKSKIGRDVVTGLKRLELLKYQIAGQFDRSQLLYDQTVKDLQHESNLLVDLIGAYDEKAAIALKAEADELLSSYMLRPGQDVEAAGNFVVGMMREAEVAANRIKQETYNSFYHKPVVNEIEFDPIKVAKIIETQYFEGIARNPALEAATQALRQRPANKKRLDEINTQLKKRMSPEQREALKRERDSLVQLSGNITARQMDEYVSLFQQAYPDGGLVGKTSEKRIAGRAAQTLQEIRDSAYSKAGVLDEWNFATSVFRQRLGFEEGTIGNILKETLGRSDLTSTQIMNQVTTDPRIVRDLVSAASITSPENGFSMGRTLQQHYLQNIGITGNKPRGYVGKLDFNEDVVRQLFSVRPDGSFSDQLGQKMVEKLNTLKTKIEAQKLDPSKITEQELVQLQGVLSENQYKALTDSIAGRLAKQKELDQLQENILLDIASKGHVEAVDRPAFARALINPSTPISRVQKTIAKFPPAVQKSIRGDFFEELMGRYSKYGETGFGEFDLWDGKKLLDDIQSDKSLRPRMEAVLGKDVVRKLVAASNQLEIIRPVAPDRSPFQGGAAIGSNGKVRSWLSLVTFRDPIRRRFVAGAYRANQLSPFLDQISRRELSQEDYLNALDKTSKFLLTTGNGITALTQTGKYDPEYAAELGNLIGTVQPEGLEFERKEAQKGKIMNPP